MNWISVQTAIVVVACLSCVKPRTSGLQESQTRSSASGDYREYLRLAEGSVSKTCQEIAAETLALPSFVERNGDILFASAIKKDVFDGTPLPLSLSEYLALNLYGLDGYIAMNNALLTPGKCRNLLGGINETAARALKKLKPYVGKVYSGRRDVKHAIERDFRVGSLYKQRTFLSSSTDLHTAELFSMGEGDGLEAILLHIQSKTGRDINEVVLLNEREVLFAPDSEFKVVSTSYDEGRKRWNVELEDVKVMPQLASNDKLKAEKRELVLSSPQSAKVLEAIKHYAKEPASPFKVRFAVNEKRADVLSQLESLECENTVCKLKVTGFQVGDTFVLASANIGFKDFRSLLGVIIEKASPELVKRDNTNAVTKLIDGKNELICRANRDLKTNCWVVFHSP